jgi:hypothetical protein
VTVFANGKLVRTLTSQSLVLRLSSAVPVALLLVLALTVAAILALAVWIARSTARRRRTPVAPRVRRTGSVA